MTFWVALRGTVQRGPEIIEGDGLETVVGFILADAQYGQHGDQVVGLDDVAVCEVVLRGFTADTALKALRPGDAVLALGLLRITAPLGITDDADLVSLSVEAYSIGEDLAVRPPR